MMKRVPFRDERFRDERAGGERQTFIIIAFILYIEKTDLVTAMVDALWWTASG